MPSLVDNVVDELLTTLNVGNSPPAVRAAARNILEDAFGDNSMLRLRKDQGKWHVVKSSAQRADGTDIYHTQCGHNFFKSPNKPGLRVVPITTEDRLVRSNLCINCSFMYDKCLRSAQIEERQEQPKPYMESKTDEAARKLHEIGEATTKAHELYNDEKQRHGHQLSSVADIWRSALIRYIQNSG